MRTCGNDDSGAVIKSETMATAMQITVGKWITLSPSLEAGPITFRTFVRFTTGSTPGSAAPSAVDNSAATLICQILVGSPGSGMGLPIKPHSFQRLVEALVPDPAVICSGNTST